MEKDKRKLVPVFTADLFEVELVCNKLQACGIAAMVQNNTLGAVMSPYSTFAGLPQVMVFQEDFEQAKAIIQEESNNEL